MEFKYKKRETFYAELAKRFGFENIEDLLVDMYVRRRMSTAQISLVVKISKPTVGKLLRKANVSLRSRGGPNCTISSVRNIKRMSELAKKCGFKSYKQLLSDMHEGLGMSVSRIARLLDVHYETIWRHLKMYNIPIAPKGFHEKLDPRWIDVKLAIERLKNKEVDL